MSPHGKLDSANNRKDKSSKFNISGDSKSVSTDLEHPVFSLKYLSSGKYCLTKCQQRDKASFSIAMHKLSQLNWRDIRSAPRHGLGYEKIDRDSLNAPIPSHITKDVNFLSFRFSGKKPMVGYKKDEIFYVVWLDRDFTLYDH